MKNLSYLVIILLLAGLIIYGCGNSDDSAASDQQLIQGTWAGKAVGMEDEFIMIITSGDFDFKALNSDVWYKGTFTLNEATAPRQADFKIVDCSIEQYKGTTARGIYKVDKDTLSFASYEPGTETRPTSFEPADEVQIFNLTRQADKK
jgi:uncharacterized protein (TIGR03067 family)